MPPIKPLPIADLSMYLMHGGPRVEELFGGVLSGEFVRGGHLYNILARSEETANLVGRSIDPSIRSMQGAARTADTTGKMGVIGHTDRSQSENILHRYQKSVAILQNASAHSAEQVTSARAHVEKHREIISRVHSGEIHLTGIKPTIAGGNTDSYQLRCYTFN